VEFGRGARLVDVASRAAFSRPLSVAATSPHLRPQRGAAVSLWHAVCTLGSARRRSRGLVSPPNRIGVELPGELV
jgi:hypothetical protein